MGYYGHKALCYSLSIAELEMACSGRWGSPACSPFSKDSCANYQRCLCPMPSKRKITSIYQVARVVGKTGFTCYMSGCICCRAYRLLHILWNIIMLARWHSRYVTYNLHYINHELLGHMKYYEMVMGITRAVCFGSLGGKGWKSLSVVFKNFQGVRVEKASVWFSRIFNNSRKNNGQAFLSLLLLGSGYTIAVIMLMQQAHTSDWVLASGPTPTAPNQVQNCGNLMFMLGKLCQLKLAFCFQDCHSRIAQLE